jgi:hypothetical protein
MSSPNKYIIDKDQEWVRRWEAREQDFRQQIRNLDEVLQVRAGEMREQNARMSRTLSEQQAIILKIREIPLIGNWLIKWAGYKG